MNTEYNAENVLSFEGVDKTHCKGEEKINSLTNVSFSLTKKTSTLITGPSGAGKTTMIYLAGLIKKPTKGDILFKGISTNNLNLNERSHMIRDEIGFIFRRWNLLPNLNILENVMMPMKSSDEGLARELLEKVEINNLNRFPCDLSFEEEQKVTLARSLVNNPSLILLDEPAAELDSNQTGNFMRILKKFDNTTILMTSDSASLGKFFNQTLKLESGMLTLTK